MQQFVKRSPLLSYFLLAYGFTWSLAVPLLLTKRGFIDAHIPHGLEAVAAFGPCVAALVVLGLTRGRAGIAELGQSLQRWRVPFIWLAFVLLSPLAVLVAALMARGSLDAVVNGQLLAGLAGGALAELIIIGGLAQGFGEEPGWRGFALPHLRSRFGPLPATLMLFPIWLFWHLPMFLSRPEFNLGAFIGFSAGIFSAAVWCTAIYDATRSVLMAALWHALINIARGLALAVSTAAFLVFGQLVLAIAIVIVVVWVVQRPGRYATART
ncbi:MAG: CPBP family intramembrane glutamic endopeptidase [Gammaproteobacteria bacterium]|jgi:membrane protease YdiL (CAAX protease family)|nr:CPBP family intramembrane glutamic endopeptidase [Gammaproteobacteria bacterium]